jgi:hypothetical protein
MAGTEQAVFSTTPLSMDANSAGSIQGYQALGYAIATTQTAQPAIAPVLMDSIKSTVLYIIESITIERVI